MISPLIGGSSGEKRGGEDEVLARVVIKSFVILLDWIPQVRRSIDVYGGSQKHIYKALNGTRDISVHREQLWLLKCR